MSRAVLAVAVLFALSLAPSVAAASPCSAVDVAAGVPIRVPLGPADFGVLPEACAATSLSLETRGSLLIAEEDFYGSILAGGGVRLRWAFGDGPWLSIWLPGIEYRLVANASLQPTSVDMGAGALGAHFPLALHETADLAPYIRLLLPTETVLHGAARTGVEIGQSLVWRAAGRIEVVGGLALPLVVATAGGPSHSSFVPALSADVWLRVLRGMSAAAGLSLRVAAEPDHALESLDPRLAVRLEPWPNMEVDLAVMLPVLGHDRTDVAGSLSVSWMIERGGGP